MAETSGDSISVAKTEQSTAKRLFTMAYNSFMKAINESASSSMTQNKFQALTSRMDQVMDKHATFLTLMHPDESDPTADEVSWLKELEDRYDEAAKALEASIAKQQEPAIVKADIDQAEVKTDVKEIKKTQRLYQFEVDSLVTMINAASTILEEQDSSLSSLSTSQSDLKIQVNRVHSIQRNLITQLEEDKEIGNLSADMQRLQNEFVKINISLDKAIKKRTDQKEKELLKIRNRKGNFLPWILR